MVPPNATHGWLSKQKAKFEAISAGLRAFDQAMLGGLRFEVRASGCLASWPDVHQWLNDKLALVAARCQVMQLPPALLHDIGTKALNSAIEAGVFSHSVVDSGNLLPAWKKQSFYRLLNLYGIVSWPHAKSALALDMADGPWGDPSKVMPQPSPAASPLPPLLCNPVLHQGITRVYIDGLKPDKVAKIGQKSWNEIEWLQVCGSIGRPDLFEQLVHVCRSTRWRKCPVGRGASKREHAQITATKLVGQGMVGALGDHLALATINLVALNLHTSVKTW